LKNTKTFVVGDIHGGLKALQQVLERAQVALDDTIIFLGDYVDGWSQSPQVLDYLIDLNTKQKCIFIKGNHDELLLRWLTLGPQNIDETMWFKHGGQATVHAYLDVSDEKKLTHITFLQNLQNYYLDDQNRLFVHAGFTNQNGVQHEFYPKLFYWERTLWETALCLDPNLKKTSSYYPKRLLLYHEIFIGHTPVTKIGYTIPINKANVWNVDTGAAFKGPLTILDIDTKQYWQSDTLPNLYPNEIGRN
jgi:serine/threonine protein phosphatase 1